MDTSTQDRYVEREGLLARLADAYQRRDFGLIDESMRPEAVLTLTGSSRLAGTYRGHRAIARFLAEIRHFLRAADPRMTFEHEPDVMTFRQVIVVTGPKHQSEMALRVTVEFADDGRVRSFLAEAEDQGLFDYVVDSSRPDLETS